MKRVFADAHYWIAVGRPGDSYADAAKKARASIGSAVIVTTNEALTEFLNAVSKGGPKIRQVAAKMVIAILNQSPSVKVIPQTRQGFADGVRRYAIREDKEYSLPDCIAMNVMDKEGIREVLTHDHHFKQDGFSTLIEK